MKKLPSNTIIFLSGAPGVGKTTIARKLLEIFPEIIVLQEIDLVRESIRGYNDYLKDGQRANINDTQINSFLNYDLIKKSTSELDITKILHQSSILINSIKSICTRLREKRIPAIIEGTNVLYSQLLCLNCEDGYFLNLDNVIYINLYSSDYKQHKENINIRRHHQQLSEISEKEFEHIRKINTFLCEETEKLINTSYYNNVLNIDTTFLYDKANFYKKLVKSILYNQKSSHESKHR